MSKPALKLGTRASKLALWQANWAADRLRALGTDVEIVEITTQGDAEQTPSVGALGSVGVFTKEIQRALVAGEVDLAVHSLKDLPTTPVDGLTLASVPGREVVNDALISNVAASIDQLPQGAKVGTGSLRRVSQLRAIRPDLELLDIRGNVDTRLAKLDRGDYDAILLAAAGLTRLGLQHRIAQRLPTDLVLPAPGQAALGIECRQDDIRTLTALSNINNPVAMRCTTAERAMLARVEGGCLAAIGALAMMEDEQMALRAVVLSECGTTRLFAQASGSVSSAGEAITLGQRVADDLLGQGAAALVQERR